MKFYLPSHGGDWVPFKSSQYWDWISTHPELSEGKFTWTLYTYLKLKEAGLDVELVSELPTSGVVISHRDFLPASLLPRDIFLVCIKADRNRHPWAQFHLVQNPCDDVKGAVIDFWPQPNLIPRDPDRGITNICYYGRELNLTPELKTPAWAEELLSIGLTWKVLKERMEWSSYRTADITVSVRDFTTYGRSNDPVLHVDSKPPNKLINSWRAGVPAIVGCESAFRLARKSPLDFLEVQSLVELKQAIGLLRKNPNLYRDMVANGLMRAEEFSDAAVIDRWRNVLKKVEEAPRGSRIGSYVRAASYWLKPAHLRSALFANWAGEKRR